jgi:hypothetical protein
MQDIPCIASESEEEDESTISVPLHSTHFLKKILDAGSCTLRHMREPSSTNSSCVKKPPKEDADEGTKLPAYLKLAEEV